MDGAERGGGGGRPRVDDLQLQYIRTIENSGASTFILYIPLPGMDMDQHANLNSVNRMNCMQGATGYNPIKLSAP